MNKFFLRCLLIAGLSLISLSLFASDSTFDSPPKGKYTYTKLGDELIDGSKSSITWTVVFLSETKAKVLITSWHEPFTCDGYYNTNYSGGLINMSWNSEVNPESECDTPGPQLIIKEKDNNTIEAKSQLFGSINDEWLSLKRVK